jgi:serine protein kinase
MSFLQNVKLNTKQDETLSFDEYLALAKEDPMTYAHPSERMLEAIGQPKLFDSSKDDRLARVFQNRVVKRYAPFADFYGIEDTIEQIVSFFRHAAQGLEERKQVLYLLGPVGSSKSSLAERIKELAEKHPVYCLTFDNEISPVFESPLGLLNYVGLTDKVVASFDIPSRYFKTIPSPWAVKRLQESEGDLSRFTVTKLFPDRLRQRCIMKTEPSDENNQDVSNLVGKVDLRKLDRFSQSDPDAYSYSGALCRGNQGVVEMVEIWKAPIKTLHPLLTATQEGNYVGTEEIGAIPFQGVVLAHSNESEWGEFRNNKKNEAFLDRIYTVKVPYCLRIDEEVKIYEKMLDSSSLSGAICAPETLKMLAAFSVLSRLKKHETSSLPAKARIYNGENLRELDVKAKSLQEYKDFAGVTEGMNGISTRFAFKILSKTFNYDLEETGADPVHLMLVLQESIRQEQFPKSLEDEYIEFIKELNSRYIEFLGNEIQKAYLESYSEYGQSLFDLYITYADAWIQDTDYKDPDTGQIWDRKILNQELEKIEKPAGIANPKDFRQEVVNFVLRAERGGKKVKWTSYEKLRDVIERRIFSSTDDLLPIISFGSKKDRETEKKHVDFVSRMVTIGYTEKMVRRLVEYYLRVRKSN